MSAHQFQGEGVQRMPTLILSPRYTEDSRRLRAAAEWAGWSVVRLANWRLPEDLPTRDLVFYGEPSYADVVAGTRHIALLQPTPDWLATLPWEYRRRRVRLATVGETRRLRERAFVKPALEQKAFPSGVYPDGEAFRQVTGYVSNELPVLMEEPVTWALEVRCFVCEGTVVTLSPYLRFGQLVQTAGGWPLAPEEREAALALSAAVLSDPRVRLPPAVALDMGVIEGQGWAVIELNSAWGAGLYGCDASQVLPVLERASRPRRALTEADHPWVRPAARRPERSRKSGDSPDQKETNPT